MAIQRMAAAKRPAHPLHYLPDNAESLVDIGCNVGETISFAHEMGIRRSFGIDINPSAVAEARKRLAALGDSCELQHGSADAIPVPDGAFDVAVCCEVIEHVPAEERPKVFSEAHRILKPGGTFILTTPAAGLFAFLDPSNMRFRFNAGYQLLNRLIGGKGREAGYEGQKHGVIWHEHFRLEALHALFAPGFDVRITRFRGSMLVPIATTLSFPFYRWQAFNSLPYRFLRGIHRLDLNRDFGRLLGYNVLMVAQRRQ